MSFDILGTGSRVPRKVVTNDELTEFLDTSDEWIHTRTGIRRRHVLTDETLHSLAVEAAQSALDSAGVRAEEIDFVLCATMRADTVTPSMAFCVAEKLGIASPAFDVNAACVGVLYCMELADSLIATGKADKILIVSGEAMSKLIDWNERSSCVLFGDGAGAMVVGKGTGRIAGVLSGKPDSAAIRMPSFEGNSRFNEVPQSPMFMRLDGQEVYKFAVNAMGNEIESVCKKAGVAPSEVDWYLPHQANVRIVDASLKKFKIEKSKVLMNISEYGNMSATSIMVLLDEQARKGTFHKGDKLLFVAFGGGLTSGAVLIEWNKD